MTKKKEEKKQEIKCGSQVRIILGGLEGYISAIIMRFSDVQVEVTYYDSLQERKTILLQPEEIDLIENTKQSKPKKIGYK